MATATKGTVLVVDDDRDTRAMLRELLQDEGFTVSEAENGREALDLLSADAPLPGVIVLDRQMPDLDGLELAKILHSYRRLSPIPVVMISGLPPSGGRFTGVSTYLEKPLNVPALLRTLDAALQPRP